MIRTRLGRLLAGLSAAALVTGLGACSAQPGTALSVGGTTYSEKDITEAAAQYTQMTGSDSIPRYQYVWSLATIPVFLATASSMGVTIDDATLDADLQQLNDGQTLKEIPDTINPALREILRYEFVYNALQTSGVDATAFNAAYDQTLQAMPVSVNPRYGSSAPSSSTGQLDTALGDVVTAQELAQQASPDGGTDGGTSQSGN